MIRATIQCMRKSLIISSESLDAINLPLPAGVLCIPLRKGSPSDLNSGSLGS